MQVKEQVPSLVLQVVVKVVEMVVLEMVVEIALNRVMVEVVEAMLVQPLTVSCSRKGLPTLLGEQVVCACNMQPFLTFCHHASIARFFFCHILGQLLTAFYHRTLAQSIDYFEQ